ncbi:outer membrane protein transport protein [uncultured Draconibacterium sp.]|uniref:OmpP1/FadL family transporter n=1 Tax=uncultured Draconibacterium sp. TaxID=1573823 RepID=UPI0029C6F6A2|nr:outer membrane protein transport protein [uncultured Draconibacterium sp.]
MKHLKLKALLVLMAGLFISSQTFATDGYFSVGYGTVNKGLAGAGIAFYQGSLINGNPAGNVFLGTEYQLGLNFFNPNRQYTVTGAPSGMPGTFGLMPGTVESDSKLFLMPSAGANWMLGENSSISAALFGNGGMNTDYPTQTFGDQSVTTTGVNLAQIFGNVSYSVKLGERHSIGVTGVLAYQYFEAKGLSTFGEYGFSADPTALSGNGTDSGFGYGFKIGYMGHLTDNFAIGAMYQSKVFMSEFDDYAGLFAEQGDFDIPSSWTVGFSWEVIQDLTVMGDVKSIMYSDVKSIANPMNLNELMPAFPNPDGTYTPNPNHVPLGSDDGSGFGWEDVMVYKVGVNYAGVDTWQFRAGFSIGDNPIPSSEVMFNILAPGVIEKQLALGLSKEVGKSGNQLHVAINYAMNGSTKGYNPMDFDPTEAMQGNMVPNQMIELEMNQFELELGFSF